MGAPSTEAVDWLAGTLAALMLRHGDHDANVFEWHPCDQCPNQPGPCACAGKLWVNSDFTVATLTALRDVLAKGGIHAEQIAEALGLRFHTISDTDVDGTYTRLKYHGASAWAEATS